MKEEFGVPAQFDGQAKSSREAKAAFLGRFGISCQPLLISLVSHQVPHPSFSFSNNETHVRCAATNRWSFDRANIAQQTPASSSVSLLGVLSEKQLGSRSPNGRVEGCQLCCKPGMNPLSPPSSKESISNQFQALTIVQHLCGHS